MDNDSNKTIEYTMGFGKANFIAVLLFIPITAIILTPFIIAWDYETFAAGKDKFIDYILLYLLGGAIVHELLHGLTWARFTSNGMKSIKFGINWKYLTPYCHCKEPLRVIHYKAGVAMPLIVMGIIPSIVGLIIGDGTILSFGIFFTWAAGGDMIGLFMLRKLDKNDYVSDHPHKMGFIREIE